jgi:rod shape-determining protein MreC
MRNLFAFIWKNQFLLLFLLLEAFAILLSVQASRHHRTAYFSMVSDMNNRVHLTTESITGYFRLRQENQALTEENAWLRTRSIEAFMATDSLVQDLSDTIYRQQYRFRVANVISNSITLRNNIIIIDKGSNQGIKPNMGVISPQGVVGIVRAVSPNFSSVLSALNSNSRISAELKGTGFRGTVVWNGKNYRYGTLEDVPSHAPANRGDSVITSSDSQIFPSGVMIGRIRDASVDGGTGFYTISLDFACDYNRLKEVYVVDNLFKTELDSLMRVSQNPAR